MDEQINFDAMLKRWIALTPSPRDGRKALLHTTAQLSQPKHLELSWFDIQGHHRPMDSELSVYTWAMLTSFQSRLAGLYTGI